MGVFKLKLTVKRNIAYAIFEVNKEALVFHVYMKQPFEIEG